MADDKHNDDQNLVDKLIAVLLRQSWLDVLGDVGKIVRTIVQGWSYKDMYEVLECEATLELEDPEGKRATFKKREKVRYLQDNVIACQDQAWGDGDILKDDSQGLGPGRRSLAA
jgi:chemotaxis regulatin CheY-phosphate phosphatase CheZ